MKRPRNPGGYVIHGHGSTKDPTFRSWAHMIERCQSPTCRDYPSYGGRGITVCLRWQRFENFLADMGERPAGLQIDRKDNNGPYSPQNCQWSDRKTQARNRRNNRFILWRGERLTIAGLSERTGLKQGTLVCRLRSGWSVERAASTPVSPGGWTARRRGAAA